MRLVLQRVSRASVRVAGETLSEIGGGLLILLGVDAADTDRELDAAVRKVAGLRVFEDDAGRMNRSCEETGGEFLVVSQFTLLADLTKGKRPGFEAAMKPPASERLYERFCERLATATGRPVKRGRFGAEMDVELVNRGPATFVLELPPSGGVQPA